LSQMILQKCAKMQHIFVYNGLPLGGGLPHRNLHFLEMCCRADVKVIDVTLRLTVFEIFAVNAFLEGQKPTLSPFLVSHLVTPKDIATKRETLCPDDRSTVIQIFTPISVTVAEISLRRITPDLIADKTHNSVAFVDNNNTQLHRIHTIVNTQN